MQFAYVFGSFAEGLPFADVDVAMYFRWERLSDPLRTQLELAAALERVVGVPVDVVVLNDAPLGLAVAALRGRLVFCRDPEGHASFLERTALQYMDTAYLRRSSLRDLLCPR